MSPIQSNRAADGIDKISLEDGSTDATTSKDSLSIVDKSPSQKATLLGIPQELRNRIFEFIYATPDTTGDRVSLTVTKSCEDESVIEAFIPISQAPPSKDAMLICRQLYTEMGTMQAQNFRQYWSDTTFGTTLGYAISQPANASYAVSDSNLAHVKHFVINTTYRDLEVPVDCHFENSRWTAFFDDSDYLWGLVCGYQGWNSTLPAPQGRQQLIHFDRKMCVCPGDPKSLQVGNLDSTFGSGFAAQDLYEAFFVALYLILDGPGPGWAAV